MEIFLLLPCSCLVLLFFLAEGRLQIDMEMIADFQKIDENIREFLVEVLLLGMGAGFDTGCFADSFGHFTGFSEEQEHQFRRRLLFEPAYAQSLS